ncbi:MAG TPA: leucine-rich repeat-containing protein kinase family protein [Pseudomonas sp.]|uniref:leucine-rich repeat-containing protein kinase family protein n=1 Tax=Pseudomonas sp. TaxID=306 RepID=UPI002EDA9A1B
MHTLADLRAGKLAGIKRLELACGLTEFPEEIFSLGDTLEMLDLSGNALTELPADLHRLKHLNILFCSNNPFTRLPEGIGQCPQLQVVGFKACRIQDVPARSLPPQLRALILTDNCIESLPDELGNCHALQKLMMAGNRLQHLPKTLVNCERLELLRIAANNIHQLPEWLLNMPALAWLACAGNPLSSAPTDTPIHPIAWQDLQLEQVLGQGASGVIQQALWFCDDVAPQPVAVKLYKGAVTSDGSPLNEMAACIAAGNHANLITVEGQIHGHPHETDGLVMQLISPTFMNLAGPPSLQTCTRDQYGDTRFTPSVILRIAAGVAAAAAHLHAHGITHGDLYGHNILWNERGDCLLGDFGAASFYPDAQTGLALERLEVRAFGILLGELIERCDGMKALQIALLTALQAQCIQANVAQRPSFLEVEQQLAAISDA